MTVEFTLQIANPNLTRFQIECPGLPLAVYREVVAHLRQVEAVDAGLLTQQSKEFDYFQSQAGGLWVQFSEASDALSRERVDRILRYYGDRHGAWRSLP
ncbi:MAG: hypothetical protein SFW36_06230 [Leptolyngbyaceae cyanobacterium bins.59]|nr:hypothetical protein [Leptolyngbyaceae cyanobacterium bins.59]